MAPGPLWFTKFLGDARCLLSHLGSLLEDSVAQGLRGPPCTLRPGLRAKMLSGGPIPAPAPPPAGPTHTGKYKDTERKQVKSLSPCVSEGSRPTALADPTD